MSLFLAGNISGISGFPGIFRSLSRETLRVKSVISQYSRLLTGIFSFTFLTVYRMQTFECIKLLMLYGTLVNRIFCKRPMLLFSVVLLGSPFLKLPQDKERLRRAGAVIQGGGGWSQIRRQYKKRGPILLYYLCALLCTPVKITYMYRCCN